VYRFHNAIWHQSREHNQCLLRSKEGKGREANFVFEHLLQLGIIKLVDMALEVSSNQSYSKIDKDMANFGQKQSLASFVASHCLLCYVKYPNLIHMKSKSD
jgi:hypothetical protein